MRKHAIIAIGMGYLFVFWLFPLACSAGDRQIKVAEASEKVEQNIENLEIEDDFEEDEWDEEPEELISDPLEPVNRIIFKFNDKVYFWVVKPLATVYKKVLAEDVRMCIRNAFDNLMTPVRVVNNLLQGKAHDTGVELLRFTINSTMGIAGLGDPAQSEFQLTPRKEDLGQTFGTYGFGSGIYLNLPLLGPSNIRDAVGLVGDGFLDPLSYISFGGDRTKAGVYAGKQINKASFTLGDYELFKETSLDPYAAIRDVYHQYRQGLIKDLKSSSSDSVSVPPGQ